MITLIRFENDLENCGIFGTSNVYQLVETSAPISLNFVKLWNPDERRNDGVVLNI